MQQNDSATLTACGKHSGLLGDNPIELPWRDCGRFRIIPILRREQEIALDAAHFRKRAARAREMAQSGDDVRLSRMLLEVALDLDAEADAMETGGAKERRRFPRLRRPGIFEALLYLLGPSTDPKPAAPRPVQIIDLSAGGVKFRTDSAPVPGSRVVLELLGRALRLDGTILRARGTDAAMVFDPASSADPALSRLLQAEALMSRVGV
jgi:hypothetical protein